jgi:hypothetical protein
MGIRSFTGRLRKIGLLPYVGKTLFCRTMSAKDVLELAELTPEEIDGAVIIIDTAVRYLKGDENSSEHMRAFAASVFRLIPHDGEPGAAAVLLLHHSAKGTRESNELTLENCMRGSGELGAFITACWGTRLQDPAEPYTSASYIKNVKPRDFDAEPFEVIGSPVQPGEESDCRLYYVEQPQGAKAVLRSNQNNVANKDGMDDAAIAVVKKHPEMSGPKVSAMLAEHGIKRSKDWVNKRRFDMLQANGGNPAKPD